MERKKIQDEEEEEWRKRIDSKTKLRTYRAMKRNLETEKYFEKGTAQQRRVMVMMRGGTNDLRIETGRYEKLEEEESICFCESGEVEDERHFLCRCAAWKDERDVVLRKVRNLGVTMEDEEVMFVSGRQEVKTEGGGPSDKHEHASMAYIFESFAEDPCAKGHRPQNLFCKV